MSSKSNKVPQRHCPYNANDIKKARGCLKLDVDKGSLGFLQRRFTFTAAGSCNNVWEGEDGYMEHVKGSFPMPEKVNEEDDSQEYNSEHSDTTDTGLGTSSESKQFNSTSSKKANNSNSREGSLTSGSSLSSSFPSSSSSLSIRTNSVGSTDRVNGCHTIFESDEEDCVIVEEEKVVIDLEEDDEKNNSKDANHSKVPSTSDSGLGSLSNEVAHWERLFELNNKIKEAKQSLKKIDIMFQYGEFLMKACDDISLLRGHITCLINQLKQAKDDIDTNNFSDTLSTKIKKKHFQQLTPKEKNTSYRDIWYLFKSLCNDFVSVRDRRKKILIEHKQYQSSSPSELQRSIQNTKLNVNA